MPSQLHLGWPRRDRFLFSPLAETQSHRCRTVLSLLLLTAACAAQEPAPPNQDAQVLLKKGLEEIHTGQLALAQRTLLQAHALAPQRTAITTNLGKLDTLLGQPNEAVALFESVAHVDPENSENQINLAIALATQGSLSLALEAANRAVRINASSGPAHHIRAKVLAAMQKTSQAKAEYQRATALMPHDALTLYDFAIFCADTGDLPGEVELLQRVVRLHPEDPKYHLLLGQALERRGSSSAAQKELRETVRLDPTNRSALYLLSRSLRKDDPGEAAKFAERFRNARLSEEELNSIRDQGNAAVAAMGRSAWSEAVAEFQQAIVQCAGCALEATLEKDLGLAQCRSGDATAGLQSLRSALALDPRDAETLQAIELAERSLAPTHAP